jgi:hypothetical protein
MSGKRHETSATTVPIFPSLFNGDLYLAEETHHGFSLLPARCFLDVHTLFTLAIVEVKSGSQVWGRQKDTRHAETA